MYQGYGGNTYNPVTAPLEVSILTAQQNEYIQEQQKTRNKNKGEEGQGEERGRKKKTKLIYD